MIRFIIKRLLLLIPIALGVSFIVFAIMDFTPGDPATMILGEGASAEAQAALREELGLNQPFILRYVEYVANAVRGNFGNSYRTRIPVVQEIASRFMPTLTLAVLSLIVSVAVGLPIGVLSAVKQYSITDNITLGVSLLLTSLPSFWLALMLILFFSVQLGILPTIGIETWRHYVMPTIATSAATIASLLRMTRSTMLEVIRQDYIRTARAKGAEEKTVIFGHALRNALLPVITIIGVNFGLSLGGAIVIEQIFAIPGLGQLMINAIRSKDTPMVLGAVIFTALIASFINLLVDIVYAYIDPRVKVQYHTIKRKKVSG